MRKRERILKEWRNQRIICDSRTDDIPREVITACRLRIMAEKRWPECRNIYRGLVGYLTAESARLFALYMIPRADGEAHELTGWMPRRLKLADNRWPSQKRK